MAIGIAILGSVFSSQISDHLATQPHGFSFADATASGGAQGVLAHAPAAARGQLDAVIHNAVGSALGTTFLVASLAGLIGTALVLTLMHGAAMPRLPQTHQPALKPPPCTDLVISRRTRVR